MPERPSLAPSMWKIWNNLVILNWYTTLTIHMPQILRLWYLVILSFRLNIRCAWPKMTFTFWLLSSISVFSSSSSDSHQLQQYQLHQLPLLYKAHFITLHSDAQCIIAQPHCSCPRLRYLLRLKQRQDCITLPRQWWFIRFLNYIANATVWLQNICTFLYASRKISKISKISYDIFVNLCLAFGKNDSSRSPNCMKAGDLS